MCLLSPNWERCGRRKCVLILNPPAWPVQSSWPSRFAALSLCGRLIRLTCKKSPPLSIWYIKYCKWLVSWVCKHPLRKNREKQEKKEKNISNSDEWFIFIIWESFVRLRPTLFSTHLSFLYSWNLNIEQTNDAYPSHGNLAAAILSWLFEELLWVLWGSLLI